MNIKMPSMIYKDIKNILDGNKYNTFVETGTYMGETVLHMEKKFNELHTIEIDPILYDNVKNNYSGNKINFYLGDSSVMLESITKKLKDNTIFFLDGHFDKFINKNTEKNVIQKDCPLTEEIQAINNYFLFKGIIIIDDYRLMGSIDNGNWIDINENNLLNILEKRIINYKIIPDIRRRKERLVIYIKEKII